MRAGRAPSRGSEDRSSACLVAAEALLPPPSLDFRVSVSHLPLPLPQGHLSLYLGPISKFQDQLLKIPDLVTSEYFLGTIFWPATPTWDGMSGSWETRLLVGGAAYCQGQRESWVVSSLVSVSPPSPAFCTFLSFPQMRFQTKRSADSPGQRKHGRGPPLAYQSGPPASLSPELSFLFGMCYEFSSTQPFWELNGT